MRRGRTAPFAPNSDARLSLGGSGYLQYRSDHLKTNRISKAQVFGIAREIELGRAWLVELARDPDEPLAQTWTPRLKAATDTLAVALEARNNTVKALAPHQTAVVLFIDDVNRELDVLEGDLRKMFAGSTKRVASFLSATRRS